MTPAAPPSKSPPLRVLGVDPGSVTTGWGVVERQGETLRRIAGGCIRAKEGDDMPQRLARIFTELAAAIAQFQPHLAAVEEVFVSSNVSSALKLGQARGAAIAALSHGGLAVAEYTAMQVKKAVVGYGKAEKAQVQEMIRMLLALDKAPPQDAADALAVALCHLNHLNPAAAQPLGGAKSWRDWSPPAVSAKEAAR
ncbi:MAG: crossover junction endodeoxyribonuclease RuvC [Magnetococcales bacterium]|nr:crossover junction endodeoxyribonuclease RuvC [Magnetococcales bacterium]